MPWWNIVIIASVVGAGLGVVLKKDKVDRFFMRFFRDVARHKARRRRFQQGRDTSVTLLSMLMKQDDPLKDLDIDSEEERDLPTYTLSELKEFGDGREERPILIGILGRVYDVSHGEQFYGEGAPYEVFAGNDITFSLGTGCKTQECVDHDAEGLDGDDLDEAKRWLSFFHLHDKYPLTGKLEDDHFQILLSELVDVEAKRSEEDVRDDSGERTGEEEKAKEEAKKLN